MGQVHGWWLKIPRLTSSFCRSSQELLLPGEAMLASFPYLSVFTIPQDYAEIVILHKQ